MAASPLFQLGLRDVAVNDDPATLAHARISLEESWYVRVPGLLDAVALARAQRELAACPLETLVHEGIGLEACFAADVTFARLEMQLNDRRVLDVAATLAGVAHVGCFRPRIYRVVPGAGHFDHFHDDLEHGRVLALTLNLSEATYRGSALEIREKDATSSVLVPNTTAGDAILFRIDPRLEHRITNIEGDVPKTALAGWFCTHPEFEDRLRRRMKHGAPTR